MNKELGAQAFAHGSDIFYGAGKSPGKDELTAHELTHTIQQGGAVPTKSVTQQEKKENKLQAKADAIQLTPNDTPELDQSSLHFKRKYTEETALTSAKMVAERKSLKVFSKQNLQDILQQRFILPENFAVSELIEKWKKSGSLVEVAKHSGTSTLQYSFSSTSKTVETSKRKQNENEQGESSKRPKSDENQQSNEFTANHIAPTEERKVLLLGEGDFSFALSLAKQVDPEQHSNITATSLDTEDEVKEKYPNSGKANIEALKKTGVKVSHGIDATTIDSSLGNFTAIVFNFPYVPSSQRGSAENTMPMLQNFFKKAYTCLPKGGKVFVTTKQYWHTRNKTEASATGAGFSKERELSFDAKNFPDYDHKKTKKDESAIKTEKAITHVYKK
jgi:hypothetical protein